jgi:two-component system C4-dicarboxylate transport sensor histidine kinase DctB
VPVEALAADNQRLRDLVAAAGRLAEFGRFAAKQIHELRQPLFAIKGLAQLLLERQEVDVGEARDFARHIVEQAERLAGLVADLRRISLPGSTAKDGRTEVAPVVLRVAALLEWRFRKGVTLRTEIAPDLPPAAIGGGALEQVLINLLSNALDAVAGRPGPLVQVRVRTPAPGTIEIGVADNGCGIARPARARLFESFFTTKGEEQGTGLGLAVSREIARGAGGDLVLSDGTDGFSEPAVTVFRCTLLAARDASGARP